MSSHSKGAPDQTRDARARAWAFIFDCYAKKSAAGTSGGQDVKKARMGQVTIEYAG